MVADVAPHMQTFFVPQMEQLGLVERESRFGSLSTVEADWGHGMLWAHSLGDKCLYTFHDMHLSDAVSLTEYTDDYICIASMTSHSAKMCPVDKTYFKERNTVSYEQEGQAGVKYELNAGERHRSFTFCFAPEFFDELEGLTDDEKKASYNSSPAKMSTLMHPRLCVRWKALDPNGRTRRAATVFAGRS